MHRLTVRACVICFIAAGCSQEQPVPASDTDHSGRMDSVIRIALEKASNPLHRDLINCGVVFVDLEDLDVPCIGLRVPMPGSDKRIFLSFTKEWFNDNSNEAVADSLISDLGRVLDDLETQSPSK